jgi:hypothetical protein
VAPVVADLAWGGEVGCRCEVWLGDPWVCGGELLVWEGMGKKMALIKKKGFSKKYYNIILIRYLVN